MVSVTPVNGPRGETTVMVDGAPQTLRLTLGALAEIETGLALGRLEELSERLARASAEDLLVVLGALVRGGGGRFADADLRAANIDLGEAASAIGRAFAAGA